MRSPATSKHATLGLLRPNVACLDRSEEHTSELQSRSDLVCRLLLEKKKKKRQCHIRHEEQNSTLQRSRDDNTQLGDGACMRSARHAGENHNTIATTHILT